MKSCHGCLVLQKQNHKPHGFCPAGYEVKTIRTEHGQVRFPIDDCPRPTTQAEYIALLEETKSQAN